MQNKLHFATSLALTTAVISGFANFLSKVAVTVVKDPIVFTTLKNAIVAVFLIGLILLFKRWQEIKSLSKPQWTKLLTVGAVGGFLPFALFFTGLARASALNASLIHKTLVIWIFLLAYPLLKERMNKLQLVGVGAILTANFVVFGGFTGFKFNLGELMILAATMLWAVENIVAKIALKDISSLTVAGARMVFGSILLFGLVAAQGNLGLLSSLTSVQWYWTVITSLLLTGYVLTWYTALKYAPATYVATLLLPATIVTNVLSAIFVTRTLDGKLVLGTILFLAGLALIIWYAKKIPVVVDQNTKPIILNN